MSTMSSAVTSISVKDRAIRLRCGARARRDVEQLLERFGGDAGLIGRCAPDRLDKRREASSELRHCGECAVSHC
jgi:hypothetical protein